MAGKSAPAFLFSAKSGEEHRSRRRISGPGTNGPSGVSPWQEAKLEKPEPVDVTILGVHVKSAGYPNVTFRVRDLAHAALLRTQEINFPFRRMTPHNSIRA